MPKRSGCSVAASVSGVETPGEASLVTFVSEWRARSLPLVISHRAEAGADR